MPAKAQADLAELKAAQAAGSLLNAEAVELEWSDVLGTVRAGMLAVPSRAGARLPHLTGHDLRDRCRGARGAIRDQKRCLVYSETLRFFYTPRADARSLATPNRLLRNKDQAHWAATVVENVRVGDKMTERYVAYLAGIGERDITRLGAQCGFWERVTRQLNRLSNRISAEDRKRVERVLQERVPCPTRLQYDQWHSEGTRLLGSDRVTPPVENWPR
jgi:hypothetical protein